MSLHSWLVLVCGGCSGERCAPVAALCWGVVPRPGPAELPGAPCLACGALVGSTGTPLTFVCFLWGVWCSPTGALPGSPGELPWPVVSIRSNWWVGGGVWGLSGADFYTIWSLGQQLAVWLLWFTGFGASWAHASWGLGVSSRLPMLAHLQGVLEESDGESKLTADLKHVILEQMESR